MGKVKEEGGSWIKEFLRTGPTKWTRWVDQQQESLPWWEDKGKWGPHCSMDKWLREDVNDALDTGGADRRSARWSRHGRHPLDPKA